VSALVGHIRQVIAAEGPISVARYMAEALGHPEHGYYRRRDPLGAAGDFITAPEVSQLFGELVGLWCAVSWDSMGQSSPVNLVELGPGRGTLMADALRAVGQVAPDFRSALAVHLVETSRPLRDKQRSALAAASPTWHDRFENVPLGPALVVANEFFDALPIHQFLLTDAGWRERLVGVDPERGTLRFEVAVGETEALAQLPAAMRAAPVGSLLELCPEAIALAREIGRRLAADGGAALVIDYGHPRSAPGETLQAVRGHAYADVLTNPGETDITAHVDFEALATAALAAGARVFGPCPQGSFLRALGIETRLALLIRDAAPEQAETLRRGCHRLIADTEMGNLFKVLAIAHPALPTPAGFED